MECTIKKYLKIVPGTIEDYKNLARFHYRHSKTGPTAAVYKIIDTHPQRCRIEPIVGIIIYSLPLAGVQLRNIATGGLFTQLGSSSVNLQLINQNIRTISRVVIEPRYRALGLAYELVQKTMPMLKMAYIEALAVMGKVNPFFEKAGMLKFEAAESSKSVRLRQALSVVGIEESDTVDIERTHEKLLALNHKAKNFIDREIYNFLSNYGRRVKNAPDSLNKTEFIISKLSDRPLYYLWRNTAVKLKI
jgi:hypothetical protein